MSHGPGRRGIRFFDAPTVGDARGQRAPGSAGRGEVRGGPAAWGAGDRQVRWPDDRGRPCSRNRPRSRKRPLSEESHVANDSARTILLPVTADAYVVFHFRNLTLHLPSRTARQGHPAPLRCPPNHSQRAFFQITPPLPDSAPLRLCLPRCPARTVSRACLAVFPEQRRPSRVLPPALVLCLCVARFVRRAPVRPHGVY